MTAASRHDAWQAGDSYDLSMGRWSRQIAPRFIDWLQPNLGLDWLEVGCGTGALSAAILERTNPQSLVCIDPSADFQSRRAQTESLAARSASAIRLIPGRGEA